MKNYWLVLAAALMLGGVTVGLAQTESNSSREAVFGESERGNDTLHERDARGQTRTQEQSADRDELRDAAGSPVPTQQRDLRRAPGGVNDAATPGMQRGAAAGAEDQAVAVENVGAGSAGLVIGGLFLALIVFILYRRSRRVEPPYTRP